MITVDCYNCGSAAHAPYLRENGFDLVRCAGCGLLYVRDRPDEAEIAAATEAGRHKGEKELDANVQYNRAAARFYRKMLAEIFGGDFSGIASWLDVGCGYGEFIETIGEVSGGRIALTGSEPNAVKQASAKARGLTVDFFDLDTHDVRYDMVSLMNVYSHLPDPAAFLRTMCGVLAPGGQILVQTGDAAKFDPDEILRPVGLPDHLSFTSEEILCPMLERMGIQILSVHKYPSLALEPTRIAKETIKAFLPGRVSFLRYYANWRRYQETNMVVRGRRTA